MKHHSWYLPPYATVVHPPRPPSSIACGRAPHPRNAPPHRRETAYMLNTPTLGFRYPSWAQDAIQCRSGNLRGPAAAPVRLPDPSGHRLSFSLLPSCIPADTFQPNNSGLQYLCLVFFVFFCNQPSGWVELSKRESRCLPRFICHGAV